MISAPTPFYAPVHRVCAPYFVPPIPVCCEMAREEARPALLWEKEHNAQWRSRGPADSGTYPVTSDLLDLASNDGHHDGEAVRFAWAQRGLTRTVRHEVSKARGCRQGCLPCLRASTRRRASAHVQHRATASTVQLLIRSAPDSKSSPVT
jgi:hypothetical protein